LSNTTSTAASPLSIERLALLCAEYAANKKAEDIVVLDMRGVSSFADYFVICSGTSEPHLKAIAGEIQSQLRDEHHVRPQNVDGYPMSQWIVVDYYDVLVHIFHHEKRAFYSLEDLWSDAVRVPLPAEVTGAH
jgi:ribosome-associated protein